VVTKSGLAQIGWADVSFIGVSNAGLGVGDDKASFAYDGDRVLTWHDGSRRWGSKWSVGDVLCFAVDMDARCLTFGLNGSYDLPMGHAFLNVETKGGVAPAVTVQGSAFGALCNFGGGGAHTFRYPPPLGCRPVFEWIVEHAPQHALRSLLKTPAQASQQPARTTSHGASAVALGGADTVTAHIAACKAEVAARAQAATAALAAASALRASAQSFTVEALTGAFHLLHGDAAAVGIVHPTITATDAAHSSALLFTATAGSPTVALHTTPAPAAVALGVADAVASHEATVTATVRVAGEFAVGFAELATFAGSWSDGTGLGTAEGGVALLNLPAGKSMPHLVGQDRKESTGCLSSGPRAGKAGAGAGGDGDLEAALRESSAAAAALAAGSAAAPARRDLLHAPGLYLASIIRGQPRVMRRLGPCLAAGAAIQVSLRANADGGRVAVLHSGSEETTHDLTAAGDGAVCSHAQWVPAITVAPDAVLQVVA
jgi:hypothetical protein